MTAADRYKYDILAVWGLPGLAKDLLEDQIHNSQNVKWLHSLSVGCDEYVAIDKFRQSKIPLTNARGAFSEILGEYVLLGILFHAKHVQSFERKKAAINW